MIIDSIIINLLIWLCKKWYIIKVEEKINLSSYYLVIVSSSLRLTIDLVVLVFFSGTNDISECLSEFNTHL